MEEEDFGFMKRDLKVLQNVMVASAGTEPGSNDRGTGADDRDDSAKVNVGDSALGSREGSGGATSETGSEPRAKGVMGELSVGREPPSIPNVVEYHLKVKTSSSPNRVHFAGKQGDQDTDGDRRDSNSSSKTDSKLSQELTKMALENRGLEASGELPQTFQVKYLGSHDARGLWGIKHTRRPVDNMVTAARALPAGTILPFIKLIVSKDGVALLPLGKKRHDAGISKKFSIDTISYGVQDLVYTRVFSMIIVRDVGQNQGISPFECHGFVCESRHHARQLTYALATAFQIYSINVKAQGKAEETAGNIKKRFAIDLRSPEEIEAALTADSEA
ncbi:uncharacterized protein LOC124411900 isoform X1 [Diprion similis]|uniref:uncharacterized protein LOC124411900 isoform X1 n=2 Tax=Diprion similis TaxID=362088 RepID=UPI001EF9298D|nr:uncharacterized protein LOC124411900 isoform X1 [Diprion similis]XP_046747390.1 uncharacterized protein LOC124411900 isoform X1 [Diprion similis]XP_046747391.1 uncharacterized protein LOC124411900 isoform X1 [Diprion similis]XP_046747392.1 uncharacterized protein LOC124411900 isoform X1 [Diprion similis]